MPSSHRRSRSAARQTPQTTREGDDLYREMPSDAVKRDRERQRRRDRIAKRKARYAR